MGLWNRMRDWMGLSNADCAIEGDRLVFRNLARARELPLEPDGMGPAEERTACDRCGKRVQRVVLTTAGAGPGQRELWRAYPLVLDGWVCTACGACVAPRRLTPDEVTEFGRNAAEHAGDSGWDDAEWWLRRILGSWPGYPPALVDLAQVELGRAEGAGGTERAAHVALARSYVERALASDSGMPLQPAELLRARIDATTGNETEALATLDRLATDAAVAAPIRTEAEQMAAAIRRGAILFQRAAELTRGLLLVAGAPMRPLDASSRARLEEARPLLRAALAREVSFPTAWVLGKVEQRMGNRAEAVAAFREAHAKEPDQPDGCRELVHALLEEGRAADAVPVARHSVAVSPSDPGLRSNLALVLLLAGDLASARVEIEAAEKMDPADEITRALAGRIAEIASGRRPHPRSLAELEEG